MAAIARVHPWCSKAKGAVMLLAGWLEDWAGGQEEGINDKDWRQWEAGTSLGLVWPALSCHSACWILAPNSR